MRTHRVERESAFIRHSKRTTPLDVARFGILSLATLPFALWIAAYTSDYYYRVEITREKIEEADEDISHTRRCFGRKQEIKELRALLKTSLNRIVVVAGTNEVGKSRFIGEVLRNQRHVTSVNLTQGADSVSSLTQAFVDAFGCRWLQMRYLLVDVLPFAGSEILVMKERYSDRDLEQCLGVITEALKQMALDTPDLEKRPVIVIDDLGEGDCEWMFSREGELVMQRLLQWCVYVTKERRLAHVILTGNEQLVFSLMERNRKTRGHLQFFGLSPVPLSEAEAYVGEQLPDATEEEVRKLTATFGGWMHDLGSACSEVKTRRATRRRPLDHDHDHGCGSSGSGSSNTSGSATCRVVDEVIKDKLQRQVEVVTTAFASGAEKEELDASSNPAAGGGSGGGGGSGAGAGAAGDDDPFLGPLKSAYSQRVHEQMRRTSSAHQAPASLAAANSPPSLLPQPQSPPPPSSSSPGAVSRAPPATWTALQLWQTLSRLVGSGRMAVPFSELRDRVFDGNPRPILDLMDVGVLGFELGRPHRSTTSTARSGGSSSSSSGSSSGSSSSGSSSSGSSNSGSSKSISSRSGGGASARGGTDWFVTPATPALGQAVAQLLAHGSLDEQFQRLERAQEAQKAVRALQEERARLEEERSAREARKHSLLRTVELGQALGKDQRELSVSVGPLFDALVVEEVLHDVKARQLQARLGELHGEATGSGGRGDSSKSSSSGSGDGAGLQANEAAVVGSEKAREHPPTPSDGIPTPAAATAPSSRSPSSPTSPAPSPPTPPLPPKLPAAAAPAPQPPASIKRQLEAAALGILSRVDPSLESLKSLRGVDRKQLEAVFEAMDVDGSGALTVDEVARAIEATTGGHVDLEAARELVRTWDLDKSGNLEKSEFLRMLESGGDGGGRGRGVVGGLAGLSEGYCSHRVDGLAQLIDAALTKREHAPKESPAVSMPTEARRT